MKAGRLALGVAAFRAFPMPAAESTGVEVRKDPGMIVRSPSPLDIETPVPLLDSWITPNDRFFSRSHLYTPKVDVGTWQLRLEGAVQHPLTLTFNDIKQFERVNAVLTLECAGNGRGLFQPRVAGAQWVKGAVGTARWAGIRLADVLEKMGAPKTGMHIAFDGADESIGNVPDFVRSVPIEKCWHPATLLAYEMNGEPLPVQHGFPLRLIVPGWEGAACVKWLIKGTVQDHEADGFFMKTAYRHPTRSLAPGEPIDAADMRPVTSLAVKSLITRPAANARVAPGEAVEVRGAAWAGENEIVRVEVSTDLGRSWQPAELEADRAPFAWRRFHYQWKTPTERGSYAVMSRAADSRGRVQPVAEQWNPSGYLYNVVDQVWIHAGEGGPPAPPVTGTAALPPGPGREIAERACMGCHDATLIAQQRLDRGRWSAEVAKMTRWGAPVSAEQADALINYLFAQFH